jgi:uncharacterized membrane protein
MHAGMVTFEPISDTKSMVQLNVSYEPEGVIENVGDEIGVVSPCVKGDLERFKEFIEKHSQETGA